MAIQVLDTTWVNKSKQKAKRKGGHNNATIHQKRAPDALSAHKMPKNPGWNSKAAPEQMQCGRLPNGDPQDFYWPNPDPAVPCKT